MKLQVWFCLLVDILPRVCSQIVPSEHRGSISPELYSDTFCSAEWFGRPTQDDCNAAARRMRDFDLRGTRVSDNRPEDEGRPVASPTEGPSVIIEGLEGLSGGLDQSLDDDDQSMTLWESWFIGPGVTEEEFARRLAVGDYGESNQEPGNPTLKKVFLPYRITVGTCTIFIETKSPESLDIGLWSTKAEQSREINRGCVGRMRKGGQNTWSDTIITLLGPRSKFEQYVNQKLALRATADMMHVNYYAQDVNPLANDVRTQTTYGPESQTCLATSKDDCAKPCLTHRDCDLSKNYRCALKGNTASDIPLDPSWGKFQCTWVPYAASLVVAAAKVNACKGRRCLLEADGTLELPLIPTDEFDAMTNPTNTTTSVPGKNTTNTTLLEDKEYSTLQNVDRVKLDYSLSFPCNCTHASPECFDSDGNNTSVTTAFTLTLPTNSTKTCDVTTGEWRDDVTGPLTNSVGGDVIEKVSTNTSVGTPVSSHGPSTSTTATSSSDHAVCQSIGNVCTSFWSCGDPDHCYCFQSDSSSLYFHCQPKTGYGTNSNGKRALTVEEDPELVRLSSRKRNMGINLTQLPELERRGQELCPCNCTYVSNGCCGSAPDGMIHEPAGLNVGMVMLTDDMCCDTRTGNAQTGKHQSKTDMSCQ